MWCSLTTTTAVRGGVHDWKHGVGGPAKLKESDIRPREIPTPKDSVFLADMRSRQESSKALQEPGTNFLGGVENDVVALAGGRGKYDLSPCDDAR